MKLGILTVPFNNNYGGFLQAFALKTILGRMGHETIFINRQRNKKKMPLWKRIVCWPFFKMKELRKNRNNERIGKNTKIFKNLFLSPISEPYYTTHELRKCLKLNCDAFVIGSDQVWRYKYAKESVSDFFGSFMEKTNIPIFSYAASFGTSENEFPKEYVKKCAQLLRKFVSVSVRECSGKEMLVNNWGFSPEMIKVVLDPTFLLCCEDYESLFRNICVRKNKYVCSYILDLNPEKRSIVALVAEKFDNEVVALNAQTGDVKKMPPIVSVEQWLCQIANASFVVTDSFHGTVFSILFNKPFIVIGNGNRGKARFVSLLQKFDLQSRYLESVQSFDKSIMSSVINWNNVNTKIESCKNESLDFIKMSLKLCEKQKHGVEL